MTTEEIAREIEAILFAAGYPVAYEKLAAVLEITEREVRAIADTMTGQYEKRGIQLVLYDKSCQLCTKEEYETPIKQVLGIRGSGGLSNSCLEVLAIIAYNQPVTRAFIEQVRGTDSSYAVGVLSDKHLIEVTGRLDVPGKPMLFSTTEDFLRAFGLSSITDLPSADLPGMADSLVSAESAKKPETTAADSAMPEAGGKEPVSVSDETETPGENTGNAAAEAAELPPTAAEPA